MRQVVNETIWRKNLRNLTRNSWNCEFRRVTLFFGTTGCAAVVRASCPTLGSLIVKVKTKHWQKFREKPVSNHCNSPLVFANCAWYLASGFDTCPWHINWKKFWANSAEIWRYFLVIIFATYKWVCYYIGICSTNIGNDYYISEMSAMNLLKLWKCERNIDFDVKFYNYSL